MGNGICERQLKTETLHKQPFFCFDKWRELHVIQYIEEVLCFRPVSEDFSNLYYTCKRDFELCFLTCVAEPESRETTGNLPRFNVH